MAGIIAQLTAAARKRKGRKQITSAKCLYTLEVAQSPYTWNVGVNDDNFQEFDRGGFQPVVHNEFLVEQAMWRQGGDENYDEMLQGAQRCYRDVTGMLQRCYTDVAGSIVTHSYREHSARQAAIDAAITKEYRKYKVGHPFEFRKGNIH